MGIERKHLSFPSKWEAGQKEKNVIGSCNLAHKITFLGSNLYFSNILSIQITRGGHKIDSEFKVKFILYVVT